VKSAELGGEGAPGPAPPGRCGRRRAPCPGESTCERRSSARPLRARRTRAPLAPSLCITHPLPTRMHTAAGAPRRRVSASRTPASLRGCIVLRRAAAERALHRKRDVVEGARLVVHRGSARGGRRLAPRRAGCLRAPAAPWEPRGAPLEARLECEVVSDVRVEPLEKHLRRPAPSGVRGRRSNLCEEQRLGTWCVSLAATDGSALPGSLPRCAHQTARSGPKTAGAAPGETPRNVHLHLRRAPHMARGPRGRASARQGARHVSPPGERQASASLSTG